MPWFLKPIDWVEWLTSQLEESLSLRGIHPRFSASIISFVAVTGTFFVFSLASTVAMGGLIAGYAIVYGTSEFPEWLGVVAIAYVALHLTLALANWRYERDQPAKVREWVDVAFVSAFSAGCVVALVLLAIAFVARPFVALDAVTWVPMLLLGCSGMGAIAAIHSAINPSATDTKSPEEKQHGPTKAGADD